MQYSNSSSATHVLCLAGMTSGVAKCVQQFVTVDVSSTNRLNQTISMNPLEHAIVHVSQTKVNNVRLFQKSLRFWIMNSALRYSNIVHSHHRLSTKRAV